MTLSIVEFNPTKAQSLAKARFQRFLAANPGVSPLNMSIASLSSAAKSPNLAKWISSNPEFMEYMMDADTLPTRIQAYAELAVERLQEVLSSAAPTSKDGVPMYKDILAAARMMLELADAYPKKNATVVFSDKTVQAMDDHQVTKEIETLRLKIAGAPNVSDT